ncbi:MAG: FAD-dependent 5-carboxymethylaminomethyl-2-thiouridine(34) oxidoreductase MnmC, partial [Pseudomonadota bacterium]
FAPSRNPDMWSAAVLSDVARLTKPQGTAATFSVASAVRENIEAAGFSWHKSPGFGRKKHMLRAELTTLQKRVNDKPWFAPPERAEQGKVAVVGAGIASAHLFSILSGSGWSVDIIDAVGPAAGASGNPAGLVMPRLDADTGPAALFYRDAFFRAVDVYRNLESTAFNACGGRLKIEQVKAEKLFQTRIWPDDALRHEDGWLHVRDAGVLAPAEAVRSLIDESSVRVALATNLRRDGKHWFIDTDASEALGPYTAVVIASGAGTTKTLNDMPMQPSLGQIDWFDGPAIDEIATDGSYIAPYADGIMTGATYTSYTDGPVEPLDENTKSNKRAAADLTGREMGQHLGSRAALRATTPDRHPIAGPVYSGNAADTYAGLRKGLKVDYPPASYLHGLYVLSGLGSRGLVTAPILGDHVAALITGGVSPLSREAAHLVHPGRFLIRALKRNEAVTA